MDAHDTDIAVVLEIFTKFGNKHIHASPREIAGVAPDLLKGIFSLQNLVHVEAEQSQQLRFPRGEFALFILMLKPLANAVESILANFKLCGSLLGSFLKTSPQHCFDSESQFLYGEGLSNIVVAANAKSLDSIFSERFGREKKRPGLLSQR